MTRRRPKGGEYLPAAAAVALCAVFLAGAVWRERPAGVRNPVWSGAGGKGVVASFHGGTAASDAETDPVCAGKGCHPTSPHRRKQTEAAFLNMHSGLVECLGCHGKERKLLRGRRGGRSEPKVAYDLPAARAEPHTLIGRPASCRGCHSPEGRALLDAAGAAGLSDGFSDPIPLRLMEKGSRRWVPQELR